MEPTEEKPAIIKQIGQMNIMFSAYLIFSSIMGLLFWFIIFPQMGHDIRKIAMIGDFYKYYPQFVGLLGVIGIVNVIGGIFLLKYAQWARVLVVLSSLVFVIILAVFGIDVFSNKPDNQFVKMMLLSSVINLCMIAAPFIISIYYLTKKDLSDHFH